jgi:hypothetical protein
MDLGCVGLRGIKRMEMLLLQLRQFPDVMPFAGIKENKTTGERRERKGAGPKHARARVRGEARAAQQKVG